MFCTEAVPAVAAGANVALRTREAEFAYPARQDPVLAQLLGREAFGWQRHPIDGLGRRHTHDYCREQAPSMVGTLGLSRQRLLASQ